MKVNKNEKIKINKVNDFTTLFVIFMSLTFLLSGCRGEKVEKYLPLTPDYIVVNGQSELEGPLNKYMYVVNEKYQLNINRDTANIIGTKEISFEIDVKFNFYNKGNITAGTGYNSYGPKLMMDLYDKEGKPIEQPGIIHSTINMTDLANKIKKGGKKEEWIKFKGSSLGFYDDQQELTKESVKYINNLKKVASFRIKTEIIEEKFENDTDVSITTETTIGNSINLDLPTECLDYLNDYRGVMSEYKKLLTKQMEDPTNTELAKKVIDLSTKLAEMEAYPESCSDNEDFINEILKINI